VSASHFSKCYRECFGRTPRAERAIGGATGTGPGSVPPVPELPVRVVGQF